MKIFVPLVIFLIAKTNFVDAQQRLLLRKLQNFEQNDSTTSWNDIIANVLVNNGNNSQRGAKDNNNFWAKYVSQIVLLYKVHIYDKIKNTNDETTNSPTNPEVSTPDPIDPMYEKPNDSKSSEDPKNEVELFEPNYHGKMQESTTEAHTIPEESKSTKDTGCPEGSEKNDEGQCTDSKSSKFILGIPNQCSTGYRRDRLGFCRKVF